MSHSAHTSSSRRKKAPLKWFEIPLLSGEFKGKKIRIPDIATTRSSKAILRESLFDTLQFDLIGKRFVEVFAGSGSVGLEALSRGAQHGYFLERNREVFDLLKHNINAIDPHRASPILGDSFEQFPLLLTRLVSEGIRSYFYFDPPFSVREGMEDVYDRTLALIEHIPASIGEKVIVEHMSTLKLPETIGEFHCEKRKKFGKSTLSYYAPIFVG